MSKNKIFLIAEDSAIAGAFLGIISRIVTELDGGCNAEVVDKPEEVLARVRQDSESEFFVMADMFGSSMTIESFVTELRTHLGGRLRETVITSAFGVDSRPEAKRMGAMFLDKPTDVIHGEEWVALVSAIRTFLTT